MRSIRRVLSLVRNLVRGGALDRDLDDELASYVEEMASRRVTQGMTAEEARRSTLADMGGVSRVRDLVRDGRRGARVEALASDVRYGWRGLAAAPIFTMTALATLALGIGATTAILSIVRAVLLQPLPYREPDRLVFVWSDLTRASYPRGPLAGPELQDLRQRCRQFEGLGAIWANTAALTGDGDPEQLRIGLVTADFFSVLGAEPLLGRTFGPEDNTPAPPPVVVIAWSLWQRRYGGDPSIIGRRILMNGAPVSVVGVMPATFRLWMPAEANVPDSLQAWRPLSSGIARAPRGQQFLRVVGRMRPGVTVDQASEEVASVGLAIGREFEYYGQSAPVFYALPLHADAVHTVRPALLAVLIGAVLLLVIACLNVANLLVARAAARRHETALRFALGATRGRLFQQRLVEGLVLSIMGAIGGLGVATIMLRLLAAVRPDSLSRIEGAGLDAWAVAIAMGVAILWALFFSLAPLLEIARTSPSQSLLIGSRLAGGPVEQRTRAMLVVVEVALGLVLLVSAGLLLRASQKLAAVDPHFDTDQIMSFRLALPGSRYRSPDAIKSFSRQLSSSLVALPGVQSVGGISHLPYDDLPNWSTPYFRPETADPTTANEADARTVTPGYFETVHARLVEGRFFAESDEDGKTSVAIVDDWLARRTWPGQTAVGKRLLADPGTTGLPNTEVTVVGVVRHLRHRTPTRDVREQMYFPQWQVYRSPLAYVVRTTADPASLSGPIRQAVAKLDPQLPISDLRPLDSYGFAARGTLRFTTSLSAAFSTAALLLACIGIYGVLAYSVTRRRVELSIRRALGASRGQIVALVMREAFGLAAIGAVLGLVAAIPATRVLRTQLYGVTLADPLTYAVAIPLLLTSVAVAASVPAWRATSVREVEALRE
jgi:putative ABC transport system permease protein